MDKSEIRVAIVRMEGTNCEDETYVSFKSLGTKPEYVHLKLFENRKVNLEDYHILVFPGGFSGGDYVRAGAIFASRMKGTVSKDLFNFIENEKAIVGICNGFQVLIELGFLPGWETLWSEKPQAALAPNISNRFECRWVYVKKENTSCKLLNDLKKEEIMALPIAHAEGRVVLENKILENIIENKQIAFRYVDSNGKYADYPWNPNGSMYNIAGMCNSIGNVLGLMPHPERAFFKYQHPEYLRSGGDDPGRRIFKSVVNYIEKKF